MIKCQTCGTENLDGSQFCDECGGALKNYVEIPPLQSSSAETPAFAQVTSVGIPVNFDENNLEEIKHGNSDKPRGVHATLIVERGEAVGTEFTLTSEESNIGRWDADNGIFPDVDLDAYDPEAKVSRRHARIRCENGVKYFIEDLGSTNGTFINRGRRLIPGNPNILNDGDEIIVGKTFLRFYIND
ncbi:MAG TPA: FHA domain-containing protein [Pyrinomonadaceae bacterium]|nr:FHA domain-containing protein [Pyrinomonadaceae bacterium]